MESTTYIQEVSNLCCLIQLEACFADTDVRTVRDDYKLNRPDVGW